MKRNFTYEDVNKAIQNVVRYMCSIENVWNEGRNLKLYDAFFNADKLLKKYPLVEAKTNPYDAFNNFCNDAYFRFQEDISTGFIKDLRVYVGRTSTFYITDVHDSHDNMVNVIYALLENINNGIDIEFNDDLTMKPLTWSDYYSENELIEEYQCEMEYIVKEFIYDVKKYMKNAIELADYIDTYKKNQVDYFDDYLSTWNDNILERIEIKKEEELENKIQAGCEAIAYSI